MAEAAFSAGLDVSGYCSQASFLLNCGILEMLATGNPSPAEQLRRSNAFKRLTGPDGMGEAFKAVAFTREIHEPLKGFQRGDKIHAL